MLPNQMFNAVLSSLRTFDPLSDTLDILIISFVFYQLLQFARKSRAGQLVKGIILILVFYGLAVMLNLKTVTWVLNNVITIGFMAAVVIFQPELRRTLERMGQSTMWANLLVGNRRSDPSLRGAWDVPAKVTRQGNVTVYDITLPLAKLKISDKPGTLFRFSFLVNENDGQGRVRWIEWMGGIGRSKNPDEFGWGVML